MPISESEQFNLLDRLAEEFAERFRRGERPALQEYTDRYPELADDIRELFPAMVKVEQVDDGHVDRENDAKPAGPNGSLRQIGDYRILGEIDRGGMGVVYEAEQVSLGRRVALKVLPRQVAADRITLERFRREARAAARLHHTNIVPVFEVGQDGDIRFYAMQFIQGQSLDGVIAELRHLRIRSQSRASSADQAKSNAETRSLAPSVAHSILAGGFLPEGDVRTTSGNVHERTAAEPASAALALASAAGVGIGATEAGPSSAFAPDSSSTPTPLTSAVLPGGTQLSVAEMSHRVFHRSVAHIGRQAASALVHAHARGVIHRDIKPSNLLLDTDGVVWVTDFGLAKAEDDGLTQTGDVLGTIRYMAPERFLGQADPRSDVYALGLTLYELLVLRPAFDSPNRLALIEQVRSVDPPRPRSIDPRIPLDLETIVLKAVEKDVKARYATAEAMSEDLRRFLADEPIRARQVSASERYWRWARRNPAIAILGGALTTLLVAVTVGSLLAMGRFATVAKRAGLSEIAERSARLEADQARKTAEAAREAAQAESYHAVLSQVKALRAGHPLGWREEALDSLFRLAVMPTPGRDLVDLRTEAVATLGAFDIRLVTRFSLPPDELRGIAFSPDGRTLITAGFTRGLDFWDVSGQRHVAAARGLNIPHVYEKTLVAFLPETRGLAVATRDHGVVFTDTRGIRTTRAPITRDSSQPKELAIDAGGHWIAVAWTEPAGITVHDAASGALVGRFEGSPFALSPDGQWLARTEQGVIVLQPLGSGGPRVELGHQSRISSFAFSADATMLAAASLDNTTTLWNVAKRGHFGTLRGHTGGVNDVAFSPDGGAIATVSADYTARIWDTETGRELATLPRSEWMGQVDWSSDGEYIAATTYSKQTVFLYRVTGRHDVRWRLTGQSNGFLRIAAHPRLDQFATLASELRTWDVSAPRPTPRRLGIDTEYGFAVDYSPNGSLLATGSWNGRSPASRIVVRDASTGEVRSQFPTHGILRSLAFDPAGQRLASGDEVGNVVVWDHLTSRKVRQFATGGQIWSIVFLDGSRRLVTHGSDSILLCNLDTGDVERHVTLQGGVRRFVADFARNRLVVAFQSGAIGSVSLPSLSPGRRLEDTHKGTVECLALSPDGRLLATGGVDHHVVLRDPLSFEPLLSFPEWTGSLRDMAFDASSRRLAIVGSDPDVELWDLAALSDALTGVGLPWDRPSSATVSTDRHYLGRPSSTAEVVVSHPGNTDPAKFDEALRLMTSGVGAYQGGRLADAIHELQQARDRLRALLRGDPGDRFLASRLSICLASLGAALRDSHRPALAIASIQESQGLLEAIIDPGPVELYNLACCYSQLSLLSEHATTPATFSARAALLDRAMKALRRALVEGFSDFALMDEDKDLDPLRGRADFQALTLDRGFPRNPFASASVAEARGPPPERASMPGPR